MAETYSVKLWQAQVWGSRLKEREAQNKSLNNLAGLSFSRSLSCTGQSVRVTFVYLADPVVVGLAVPIVPAPPVVGGDFCAVFGVVVVVRFAIAPVLVL